MGCLGSKDKLTKEDMEFLKSHTRYDEATIKEWYKGFKVKFMQIIIACAFLKVLDSFVTIEEQTCRQELNKAPSEDKLRYADGDGAFAVIVILQRYHDE